MLKDWKKIKKSLLTTFTLLAAVVIMAFSSTVYAATQVTVTFNANGGTCSKKSKLVTYQKAYGELPNPTRTGYEFLNWYSEKEKGSIIVSATPVSKNYNHTIYARWKAKTYTVYFHPEKGTVSPTYKKVVYDQPYGTLPSPSRTGYNFAGWYDKNGKRIYSTTPVTTAASHDLYAKWTPIIITISLNANGGSVSKSSVSFKYDDRITGMPKPTKAGNFVFAGWSRTQTGTPVYFEETVNKNTENFKAYARWYIDVMFNTNGGSYVGKKRYILGTPYGSFPTTSMSGYRFLGWYPNQSKVRLLTGELVKELQTVYARWEKVTGKFKPKGCYTYDREGNATYHSAESHLSKFNGNSAVVQGLRNVVRAKSNTVQKYAALYALDAVGSYYCQEQRNTDGAYDCSSLVGRAYTFAGVTSTFGDLPVTAVMKPRLDELVKQGKAIRVTDGNYQTGDIMFNNSNYTHVSIYIGEYNGVKYRISAEGHAYGVGYFDVSKRTYTYVYRLK